MTDHERRSPVADHELLTCEEAAAHLRVACQTVYRLLRGGGLPGVKVGRQWRVRRADLDAYLTAPVPPAVGGAAAKDPAA